MAELEQNNQNIEQKTAPSQGSAQTFSAEYVHELREENKSWRIKATDAETRAKTAEEAATNASKTAKDSADAAKTEANERIKRAEIKAAAIAAGMIDLDGLKLADLSKVTLKEDGTIEGVDTMLTEFKTAKPYLFGTPNSSSNPTPTPNPKIPEAKKATEMTAEEYAAAKTAMLKSGK
jgi:hypothetical protein